MPDNKINPDGSPFAFDGLDRVFHERARLGIVTSRAGQADGLLFPELKSLCGLTDGNLNRHLQVLDDAGNVVIEKDRGGMRPVTRCRLTGQGRADFCAYLSLLENIIRQAKSAAWPAPDGTVPSG